MNTVKLWLRGLVATFISGGAAAVTATVSVCVVDQTTDIHKLLSIGTATFVMNGILGVLFYLKQSPLPGVSENQLASAGPSVAQSSLSNGAAAPQQQKQN